MQHRLLTTLLSATALLLGTLGCAKKEDAAPVGAGSYKVDGIGRNCSAQVLSETSDKLQGVTYNVLAILLTTTPRPASGIETLELHYFKPADQPISAYIMGEALLYNHDNPATSSFSWQASTLATSTLSSFSGTFSAKIGNRVSTAPSPNLLITDGVFTNARL